MLAVIKTGGKQYLVFPEKKIKIEKLDIEVGEEVVFDQVLLLASAPPGQRPGGEKNKPRTRTSSVRGEKIEIEVGTPFIEGAKVFGKVLSHGKGKKLIVFSYRPKKRYRRKKGHRQQFSEVEITKIENK